MGARGRIVLAGTLACALLSATQAYATFTMKIQQVGSNVVVNGSGSIDATDLTMIAPGGTSAFLDPVNADIGIGGNGQSDLYLAPTGLPFFGPGTFTAATSSSGDIVEVYGQEISVPRGYASGAPLSDTATYAGQTFTSLGLTPGVYTDSWGTGVHADSLILDIVAPATPEPGSLALLGAGLAGIGIARRRRR